LESLTSQIYPKQGLKILVVNDGSTDDTAQITKEFMDRSNQVELIELNTLPPGWLGKSHACWVGANAVQTDWLCFVDADTRHAPELISTAIHTALDTGVDMLSLHPRQEMLGFWERLLMPIPFMTLMILLDAKSINNPNSTKAMANGQFILIKKDVYTAIGGHAAIHNQVLEDVAFARLVKSSGYKLKLLGGGKLIHTRMYTALKALWEGLARGGSELFGIPLTILAVISSALAGFIPIAYPFWRLLVALGSSEGITVLSALIACTGSIAWYSAHALAFHTYRVPYRYLLLLPLSNLLIAIVNAEGIFQRLRSRRVWKGRTI
jgi:chlorobactene glucosyltransferase